MAAIAGKNVQKPLRSYGNHSSAIVVTTVSNTTTIAKIVYQTFFPAIAAIVAIVAKKLPFFYAALLDVTFSREVVDVWCEVQKILE